MDKTMTRFLAILAALTCAASAQTYRTVTADTNNAIRTNFSLVRSQVSDLSGASFAISNVTGLQTALDGKLATNGSAFALTNFPASLLLTNGNAGGLTNFPTSLLRTNGDGSGLTNLPNANLFNAIGVLPVANGGSGATNQAGARTAFGLGSSATNDATAFQPASSALTNLSANNGGSVTNLAYSNMVGLGTAATNDATAFQPASTNLNLLSSNNAINLTNFPGSIAVYPALTNNSAKVLAVSTNETGVEWVAVSNTVTDASTLTNFPAIILQTNSPITNFPTLNQNTTGTASNVTGIVEITNGGTGTNSAEGARVNLLPSYGGNANRVLAINGGATDVEWVVQAGATTGFPTTNKVGFFNYALSSANAEFRSTNLAGLIGDFTAGVVLVAGTTNAARVAARWQMVDGLKDAEPTSLVFTNDFEIGCYIGLQSTNFNGGESRVMVGAQSGYVSGDPTNSSLGWRVSQNVLYAAMHNGTAYSEPFSSSNVFSNAVRQFVWTYITGDGSGNVSWYVDGQLLGTATNGPTNNGAGHLSIISHNNSGGTTANSNTIRVLNFITKFNE
jgi:hypothetical protein